MSGVDGILSAPCIFFTPSKCPNRILYAPIVFCFFVFYNIRLNIVTGLPGVRQGYGRNRMRNSNVDPRKMIIEQRGKKKKQNPSDCNYSAGDNRRVRPEREINF